MTAASLFGNSQCSTLRGGCLEDYRVGEALSSDEFNGLDRERHKTKGHWVNSGPLTREQ
jgi:hypothetical protein